MSFEHQIQASDSIVFGDVLPAGSQPSGASSHLYISLSDLVVDSIFYHPGIESRLASLEESERKALDAVLKGKTISEHFVSVLVKKIKSAVDAGDYHSIRLCLSDADSYEYRALIGGTFESVEVNPAMGNRGVSRLVSDAYHPVFSLECEVVKQLHQQGIHAEIIVPFVRALSDAAAIIDRLAEQGLSRGLNGLKVLYSCDIPSSALLCERLLQYFDGVVIHIDHLTQFTLGIDKYNDGLSHLYKPENEAVTTLIDMVVKSAHQAKKPVAAIIHALDLHPKFQVYVKEQLRADILYVF